MPSRAASSPILAPWLVVATALGVVSALPLLGPLPGAGGLGPRVLAFAFVLGQMLALGLTAAAVEGLAQRVLPVRPALRWGAFFGLLLGLGWFVLAPDLENFTLRTVGRARELWLRGTLVAVTAAGLVVAFALARRLSAPGRRRWGWVPPAVGALVVALANTRLLPGDYPGVHATLLALAGLAGRAVSVAAPFAAPAVARRSRTHVALAFAGGLAAAAALVPPPSTVRLALAPLSAAVLADHLPPWGAVDRDAAPGEGPVDVPEALRPHFQRGPAEPARPPTTPPLFGPDTAPIVLLLTVDSMRSEVLANPANVARLPTLHRLRDAGFFVPRAVSPSTVTRFTMASLFTGLNVPSLRWVRDSATQGSLVKEPRRRLAEHLSAGGVETLHVVTQYELVNIKANAIGRGFADELVVPPAEGARVAYAPAVMDAITARLERAAAAGPKTPLFVFSHLMDAHHPWDTGRTAGADAKPYDRFVSELENVDAALARLDAVLTERGLWPRTLLVVAADHGQAFGQHGWPYHGGAPYEEQIRVPLIVYGPAVRPARSPCDLPLLDLTPTILDLFGRPTPGDVVGHSLVPALRGDAVLCGRPLYSSTWDMFGLVTPDGRKVIDNRRKRTRELFDLDADPAETRNLCPVDPTACDAAVGLLGRYLELQGFIPPPK